MEIPAQNLTVDWDDFTPNIHNQSMDRNELNRIIQDQIQGSNLCSIQLDNPPDAPFDIIKRIGTESNDGEIYLVQLKGADMYAVFKIIPYKNQDTEATFLNEFKIAERCSNMVKQGICKHFPITYTSYKCNNLIFPSSSLLYKVSFKYEVLENAFQSLEAILDTDEHLRDARELKISLRYAIERTDFADIQPFVFDEINKFLNSRNIHIVIQPDVKIKGFVIVNELGQMDLSQYISHTKQAKEVIKDEVWIQIIGHILNGIKCLQMNNILHDDLHMGNVLLLNKTDGYTWLIHDFGKSKILTEWTLENKKKDVLDFIGAISSTNCKSKEIGTLLTRLTSDIQELVDVDNFMDAVIDKYSAQSAMLQTAKNAKASRRKSRRKSKNKRKVRSKRVK